MKKSIKEQETLKCQKRVSLNQIMKTPKQFIFLFLIIAGFTSCKKDIVEDTEQDLTPTTQTQVTQGELVRINFPAGVPQQVYQATFGGVEITLLQETPNDVVFMVPTSIAAGYQELVTQGLNNFRYTYEVSQAQLEQPVEDVVEELNQQFVNYSSSLGNSETDLFVQQGLARYTDFVNNASEDEKRTIALVYAQNKNYIDGIINEDFSSYGKTDNLTLTKFAISVTFLGGGSWMLICGVGVEKVVGAAIAYIAFGKAKKYLSELRDESIFQVNLAIGDDLGDINKAAGDTLVFSADETVQTSIAIVGRRITTGDAGQGNDNLNSFFGSLGGYNGFAEAANTALSWINENIPFADFELIVVESLPAEAPEGQNALTEEDLQNLNLSFGNNALSFSGLSYAGGGNVQFEVNYSGPLSQLPIATKLNFSVPGLFNTISGSFDAKIISDCTGFSATEEETGFYIPDPCQIELQMVVAGGTPPYTYVWYNPSVSSGVVSTGPTYLVPCGTSPSCTITDANGCEFVLE